MTQAWQAHSEAESPWVPHGLPGWLRSFPGWAARGVSESRFGFEIAEFQASLLHGAKRYSRGLPDGGGRPVLIIPGFGFGDPATLPMQMAVAEGGYQVVRSGIWANIRCPDVAVERLGKVADRVVAGDGGRRLLVSGHSRGGMLARGLAARFPHLVERVVSLGAPLNYEFAFYEIPQPMVRVLTEVHHLDPQLRRMKCATSECTCAYMTAARRELPPEVELISIYSQSDGIIDWRSCIVPGAVNIEVTGSHLGMGLKPKTLRVVMEALALPRQMPGADSSG